jgi:peptidoglycan hydrolase-like protein with peptidoglycan-binding domain
MFLRLQIHKLFIISVILVSCAGLGLAQTTKTSHSSSTSKTAAHRHHAKSRKGAWKKHGQQGIQPERARAIQEALIREHYLTGEPSGTWDARTQEAMARYQAENGWQSKVTPDSRALIKLGLGPNYSDKNLVKPNPRPASDSVASNAGTTGSK